MRVDPAGEVADELRRRGLAPAARLLVDAHRPLAPLLADAAAALGPLVRAVGGSRFSVTMGLLDEDGLDRLVEELSSPEEQRARPG